MTIKFLRRSLLIGAAYALSLIAMTASGQQITNIEAKGNLESLNNIDCGKASDMKNIYSPADLSKSMLRCVKQKRFDDAVFIFALSGVYGNFDTLRVSDQSAHQAVDVLRMTTMQAMTPDGKKLLMDQVKATLGDDAKRAKICKEIQTIGVPAYYPRYMVQHGMNAIIGNSNGEGLVQGFDSDTGMRTALKTYLHCPENQ